MCDLLSNVAVIVVYTLKKQLPGTERNPTTFKKLSLSVPLRHRKMTK